MRVVPALRPEAPAFLRPFFLIMKLAPMKKLEDKAKTKPLILSEDIPLYMSLKLWEETSDAITGKQKQKTLAFSHRSFISLCIGYNSTSRAKILRSCINNM